MVRSGVSEIAGPLLNLVSRPADFMSSLFQGYANLINVRTENADLRRKLSSLQIDSQKIPQLREENIRLRELLQLVEQKPKTMMAARVIGEDLRDWFKCIIIDRGLGAGVKEKMPVITAKGLVGQAVEVTRWYTKVMVVNDANSSVDVYVEGKETRGILEGAGQTLLKLKYVKKNDEIAIGDKLVTSGKDNIYPKGLPAGIVTAVNREKPGIFADMDVMPFNDFRKLQEVLILK